MPSPRRLLLAGVAVAALGVLGGALLTGDEVPDGTSVAGLDVGGLTSAQARARIADGLADRAGAPLRLVAAGEELSLDPRRAGLSVDAGATAAEALDVGPLDRLRSRLGVTREVEPVVAVDEDALSGALEGLAKQVDRPAREGSIRFDALEPVPTLPAEGRELDVDGAVEAVRDGWLQEAAVEVPVEVAEVRTSEADVRTALEGIATPAVAAPVTVEAAGGGGRLVVEPPAIAAALTVAADDRGRLVPVLDREVLYEQVRGELRRIGDPPVDATFDVSSGTPVVVPSKPGRSITPEGLERAVLSVLTDDAPRRASAPLGTVEARITTERARTLGVREVMGTFTSRYPCCAPRVTNIQRIAKIVDGAVVLPGERFDLNAFVGPRDRARGFVPAPQILEGEFVDSVGGGVSQFATAIFNAVFFSGLKDITHSPHSYYISRYPPGREATVSFPLPDLIFENDTPHGVLIKASATGTAVTVTFWGTKRFDEVRSVTGPRTRVRDFPTTYDQRPTCSGTSGGRGFDIVVTRVFVQGGREVRREDFKTRYKPQPKVVCGPPPGRPSSPAPAPSPTPR